MKKYPGQDFAEQHGYTLYSHTTDKENPKAVYTKGEVALMCAFKNGELYGDLYFHWKSLMVRSGYFSIPGNFDIFENHITQAVLLLFV